MSYNPQDLHRRLQTDVGARLKAARKRAGQGQKTLANALRLSRTSISNMERGTQRLFIDHLYEAAHALKIEVTDLLPPVAAVVVSDVSIAGGDRLDPAVIANAREVALEVPGDIKRRHLIAAKKRKHD